LLDEGIVKSGSDIARQEGLNPTTVWELLRLTLLSPANVQAMLAGRQQPICLGTLTLALAEEPRAAGGLGGAALRN
jgi:hypothetical protein